MAKRFNIHEWQANQWLKNQLNEVEIKKVVDQSMDNDAIGKLQDVIQNYNLGKVLNTIAVIIDRTGGAPKGAAQMIADLVPYIDLADDTVTPDEEEFTPDLEDDELKRGAIQQMMAKEKNLNEQESEYELSDEEKDSLTDMTNGFVRKLTDVRGGNYSGDRLLAALQFVQLVIQDAEPMLYNDEDELDEANMTGTGASFTAGAGMGHFGKSKKKRKKTSSGYMGYSEPVNEHERAYNEFINNMLENEEEPEEEPEEELEKDIEKISNLPVLDKVNTKPEWEDMMQVAWDMADDIKTVNDSHKKQWLQTALKSFNKI